MTTFILLLVGALSVVAACSFGGTSPQWRRISAAWRQAVSALIPVLRPDIAAAFLARMKLIACEGDAVSATQRQCVSVRRHSDPD